MPLALNQIVTIYAGQSGVKAGTGVIKRISSTGKRITILRRGITHAFYRNHDNTRYVNNPGSGIFGNMLNDYFEVPQEEENGTKAA